MFIYKRNNIEKNNVPHVCFDKTLIWVAYLCQNYGFVWTSSRVQGWAIRQEEGDKCHIGQVFESFMYVPAAQSSWSKARANEFLIYLKYISNRIIKLNISFTVQPLFWTDEKYQRWKNMRKIGSDELSNYCFITISCSV